MAALPTPSFTSKLWAFFKAKCHIFCSTYACLNHLVYVKLYYCFYQIPILFIIFFLRLLMWHMEVPSLGVELSCSCQPMPQSQQCGIQAASVTYSTGHGEARGQGSNPYPHGYYSDSQQELLHLIFLNISLSKGLIPGFIQGVKDPAFLQPVEQVTDTAWIGRCCGCGVGRQLQLRLDPQPRNFHTSQAQP